MSLVNTPPRVRNSRSLSRLSSASSSDEQTVGIFFVFFRRQVVQVLVDGVARVDLVLHAVQAGHQQRGEGRYGLAVGSGKRASMRRPFGLATYGMRIEAERLRAE